MLLTYCTAWNSIFRADTCSYHIHNSEEYASKIRELKVDTEVSFNVTSLFTSITTTVLTAVRRKLEEDSILTTRNNLNTDQICSLVDLCLSTTYLQRWILSSETWLCHGLPVVANLWKKWRREDWTPPQEQQQPTGSGMWWHLDKMSGGTGLHRWHKLHGHQQEITREHANENRLAFQDCAVITGTDGKL